MRPEAAILSYLPIHPIPISPYSDLCSGTACQAKYGIAALSVSLWLSLTFTPKMWIAEILTDSLDEARVSKGEVAH